MDVRRFREYQKHPFKMAQGRERLILNMPTGWGKSFLICALAASDLQDCSRRVIIVVPQRVIAKGFAKGMLIRLPGGRQVDWPAPRNLCDDATEKVDALARFIRYEGGGTLASRVVVTTHMTLCYALQTLADEDLARAVDNITLAIDEAHHVLASEDQQNAIGRQVARLLDVRHTRFKLWLSTAYFFRGDRLPIISETDLGEFERIHIPFDEYWNTLKYIESYSYDFVAFKGTVFTELDRVLRAAKLPTIIYCPPEGHKMLLGRSKARFVLRVMRLACRHLGAKPWKSFDQALRENAVVIDLVEQQGRDEKVRFIDLHGERVVAVLTVGMFREGADWVQASRIVDLVPTNSDQDRLQRFGRIVRDWPTKTHVSYVSFFPFSIEQDENERRRQLSKLFAHFHASLVLANAIRPICVKVGGPRKRNRKSGAEKQENVNRRNLLGEFSEEQQESIIGQCYAKLIKLQVLAESSAQDVTPDEVRGTLTSVLSDHGVTENVDETAKQVLLLMRRKANVALDTDDLVDAGFDKVWSTDVFEPIIAYSGQLGGPSTLAEIRTVIEGVFDRQWEENFERIRTLPNPPHTQSNSYWWCTHNRTLRAKEKLDVSKIRRLESIPWWSWTTSVADRWREMFDKVSELGACPPATTPEYAWVRHQRRQHADGKLNVETIKLLEEIPWWHWASLSDIWDSKFSEVSELEACPSRGTTLYDWVRTQRKSYKRGSLAPERVSKLEDITWWQWAERAANRDEGLKELKRCIQRGAELGQTKSQVASAWATTMQIGADQVHKYLRLSSPETRDNWDRLVDERGRRGA